MRSTFIRLVMAAAMIAALAACASKVPLRESPVVHRIALIPASEPRQLTLLNQTVAAFLSPIVETGVILSSRAKAREFSEAMQSRHLGLAARLTTTVVEGLRRAGYRVDVLDQLVRPVGDPDDIDYDKLGTDAEVIVQLRINEVGVFSSRTSSNYLPRVNVDGKLYVRAFDDAPYDETLFYGVDAQTGHDRMIMADPKLAYPTFDAVMASADQLGVVFQDATDRLASLLTADLLKSLATNTRPPEAETRR